MEAGWFKSGRHHGGLTDELPVVVCLNFRRRDIPDGAKQSLVVVPSHPFQYGQFDGFSGFPGAAAMNHLGLVQPVDRLGHGIVAAVATATNRRLDARLD